MNIDDALSVKPDDRPSPFFARRVMRSIREPAPIAIPWRRVAIGAVASAAAVGTVASIPSVVDVAAVVGFVVIGIAVAGIERLVHS